MKEELLKNIGQVVKEMGVAEPKVFLDVPPRVEMGDYSSNVAMIHAKDLGQSPVQMAESIKAKLEEKKLPHVSKMEVSAPGFINFFFSQDYYAGIVQSIISKKEKFGENGNLLGKKVIIEYTDPNPFKEFHIGHLMSNSIGESISRLKEAEGADIKRLTYGGDVGLHVAKAIYSVLKEKELVPNIKKESSKAQLEFWANAYVKGSSAYEKDEQAKTEIDGLNKIIFDKSDKEVDELYAWGRELSIAYFLDMFQRLGSHFDQNFWESEMIQDALQAVDNGLQNGILEKSEGAVIFRGEKYGLHTRVFVNSRGVPTYEAKELGLAVKKDKSYQFDSSIVITGNEQNDYFKVLLKVIDLLLPRAAGKTVHIGHGMLRFASGKMSSRLGNVITAEALIEEIKNNILEKMEGREMSAEQKEKTAEMVAIAALKYSILRQASGKDIIFDMDKSISFDGDSGPYLQYATVRTESLLRKASGTVVPDAHMPEGWQTTEVEKHLERFPDVVKRAAEEFAPHLLTTYLTELSGAFNAWYAGHKIIDPEDKTSPYRVAITECVMLIMKSGLHLLGIQVPKEM